MMNKTFKISPVCGKEEISLHGLDMYDSKARFQWATFPRFTSIDPMCEKYYNMSPYAYCNGDFVNAVDPDGKYITYHNSVNRQKYVYYKGNFYTFSREKGRAVPISRVYVPEQKSNLMYNVLLALRKMDESKNKYVQKVFNTLADLNNRAVVTIRKAQYDIGEDQKGSFIRPKGKNSTIWCDLANDRKHADFKGIGLNYYELIGHELKHAYDFQFHKNGEKDPITETNIFEYYTVNFENLLRKEQKRKLRTRYNDLIPKKYRDIITIWN